MRRKGNMIRFPCRSQPLIIFHHQSNTIFPLLLLFFNSVPLYLGLIITFLFSSSVPLIFVVCLFPVFSVCVSAVLVLVLFPFPFDQMPCCYAVSRQCDVSGPSSRHHRFPYFPVLYCLRQRRDVVPLSKMWN